MTMILGFITSKIGGPLFLASTAIFAIWLAAAEIHVHILNGQINDYQGKLAASQASVGALDAGLKTCNGKVDALKAEGDRLTNLANSALAANAEARASADSLAKQILSYKSTSSDKCKAADEIFLKFAR